MYETMNRPECAFSNLSSIDILEFLFGGLRLTGSYRNRETGYVERSNLGQYYCPLFDKRLQLRTIFGMALFMVRKVNPESESIRETDGDLAPVLFNARLVR